MINICQNCQCDLLKEIGETTGVDVSGLYCAHNQVSGPVDAQGAAQLMQTFVQELHQGAAAVASLPIGEGEPMH